MKAETAALLAVLRAALDSVRRGIDGCDTGLSKRVDRPYVNRQALFAVRFALEAVALTSDDPKIRDVVYNCSLMLEAHATMPSIPKPSTN